MGLDRDLILIVGKGRVSSTPFVERNLRVKRVTAKNATKLYNEARAVLVTDFPGKFSFIKECFASFFPQAHDHGLICIVIARSVQDQVQIDAIRKSTAALADTHICLVDGIKRIAEIIRWSPVGPAKGEVTIEPHEITLSENYRLLLQRAFHDCESIYLEPLAEGKASLSVFCVHARVKQWEVGPHPMPFFVKIATPQLAIEEKKNYDNYAEHYVPFHLRPNLDGKRCIRTTQSSALVGNFVDGAISLRKALRAGQCGTLFSLFETTLRGFRLQPTAAGTCPGNGLTAFVKSRTKADMMPEGRTGLARSKFGLSKAPVDLEKILCEQAEKVPCLEGPFHGDLHTGNVMIRGGDAILIDFGSAGYGPLTADPAALEASLMFGTDENEDPESFDEWRSFLDDIYHPPPLTLRPPALFESQPSRFSWLRRPLRELRHVLLGCDCEKIEAEIVLAAYLMRYARLPIEELPANLSELACARHTYALVIAARIIEGLNNKSAGEAGA